jgi:GntR family transcriptional regulator
MLRIDLGAATPAYEQIANGLRALLVAAAMAPGEQLPTVRQLALDLGVHHNTVAEAYRQLAAEGWLDLRRRRGAIILDRPTPASSPEAVADFARRLEELIAKAIGAGVPRERIAAELETAARHLRKGAES